MKFYVGVTDRCWVLCEGGEGDGVTLCLQAPSSLHLSS